MLQPAAVQPLLHSSSKNVSKQGSFAEQLMEFNKTHGVNMKRAPKADKSAMGGWEQDIREGCPYISNSRIKLDRALRITRLIVHLHKL
jgi:hypothetical protein